MRVRVYMPPFGDASLLDDNGFVQLPAASTLDDLFRLLKIPFRRGAVMFCMVNYERSPLSRELAENDTVSFLSLVAGG